MDHKSYLITELPKLIPNYQPSRRYLYSYYFVKIKRFLIQTSIILVVQYIIMLSMGAMQLILPMYSPIGVAMVIIELLGKNALLGLLLGELSFYLTQGIPLKAVICYLIADLGCSYLGTILCQNVFSADIKPGGNYRELCKFFGINALITSSISALLITYAANLSGVTNISYYQVINLWFATLNAILIFYITVHSWLFAVFSKEKITTKPINKLHIYTISAFILGSVLFKSKIQLIYVIIPAFIIFIYYASLYGYLIATMLLFIGSNICLSYFEIHGAKYGARFDYKLYVVVAMVLLLYTIIMLYVGHFFSFLKKSKN